MEKTEKTFWLARDKDGELNLFTQKPYYDESPGFASGWNIRATDENDWLDCLMVEPHLFPEVTFENSPVEIKFVKV